MPTQDRSKPGSGNSERSNILPLVDKELWRVAAVDIPALRDTRYRGLRRMLDQQNLDALVVLAPATLGRKGALRYVTNYAPISRYAGVVFPRVGSPVLFVPYAVHAAWADNIGWVDDVRMSSDFAHDSAAALLDLGCGSGRIGLVGEDTLAGFASGLADHLPDADLVGAASALGDLRIVKDPLEVQLARHAAAMADHVFDATTALVAEGATENEVLAAGESQLRRMHAEECLLLIDSQGRQVMPHPAPRRVEVGDVVQYSVEPVSPGGHWIQSIRMFSRGAPDPRVREVVDAIVEALGVAESTLAPGVRLGAVAAAMAEVLNRVTPQRGKAPYGHGIGMDNFEPPLLSADSDVVAQENMVIVIHPALVAEGRNYYVGDTYLVTPSGAERVSHYPLELAVV